MPFYAVHKRVNISPAAVKFLKRKKILRCQFNPITIIKFKFRDAKHNELA